MKNLPIYIIFMERSGESPYRAPDFGFTGSNLIDLSWIVGISTFAISMTMFLVMHFDEIWVVAGVKQFPTLSLAGSYSWAQSIFTSGLHLLAFLCLGFFVIVYRVHHDKIDDLDEDDLSQQRASCCSCCYSFLISSKEKLHTCNWLLLSVGSIFSFTLYLTASIPLTLHFQIHGAVAFIMFISGVTHVLLFTNSIGRVPALGLQSISLCVSPPQSPAQELEQVPSSVNEAEASGTTPSDERATRTRWFHSLATIIILPLNIILLLSSLLIFLSCGDTGCREFSVNTVVVVEYTICVAFGLYFEGFRSSEFQRASFRYQPPQRRNCQLAVTESDLILNQV